MDETTPFSIDMEKKGKYDVGKSHEELKRIQFHIINDQETQGILEGFANSIEKLQKSFGRGDNLDTAVSYVMQFSEHLVSGSETVSSANSILNLNVPQKRDDLIRLTVKIKHCMEGFEDNMDSARKAYEKINKFAAEEVPETNCSEEKQVQLLKQIHWVAGRAIKSVNQSITHGEKTLSAINEFNKENKAYHFGYRTILHGILLLVGIAIITANILTTGLTSFETFFITIGFILYILLEHAWWAFTARKITVAKNGIEKQIRKLKILEENLLEVTPNVQK